MDNKDKAWLLGFSFCQHQIAARKQLIKNFSPEIENAENEFSSLLNET
ncbi:hypothetical protein O5624_02520 [Escherichia coli]|nr:hypothetical protein [Escherichia coli]